MKTGAEVVSGNEVIVCAGPPQCPFVGDAAIENAISGCPLCRHIVMHFDGTESEYQVRPQ